MKRNGTVRLETILCLALLESREETDRIISFLGTREEGAARELLETLAGTNVAMRLKALAARDDFSGIADIHPAWLVEALKRESPRVIGVILRHLPSKHVRHLLEHLPKRIVLKLPKWVEAFYVPNDVLDIIRKRFERHFVPMPSTHRIHRFEFQHLTFLSIGEIETLSRDLGLSEVALALVGADSRVVKMIVNRFATADGKILLERTRQFRGEEAWLLKEARYSILEIPDSRFGADDFLKELGLRVIAKAFGPKETFFEALKQKLSPEQAAVLKRGIDERRDGFHALQAKRRQESILKHVKDLCGRDKISKMWLEPLNREAA